MQRYVSSPDGAAFDSIVSYDTPSHAGVVLRNEKSGDGEKIMVVPEGTQVRVIDSNTGAYWYVDVFYDGELYNGYIFGKYIESIN